MTFDLKALFGRFSAGLKTSAAAKPAPSGRAGPVAPTVKDLPLIGKLKVEQQFQILGGVFLVSLLVLIAAIYLQTKNATEATSYLAITSNIRPLAQQIPKAAIAASQGDAAGFRELRETSMLVSQLIEKLSQGGDYEGAHISPAGTLTGPALEQLAQKWQAQDRGIKSILDQEKPLIALGKLAKDATALAPAMSEAARQAGDRMLAQIERVLRGVTQLAWAPGFDVKLARQLNADLDAALDIVPPSGELSKGLESIQSLWTAVGADMRAIAQARDAAARIGQDAEDMAKATDSLYTQYRTEISNPVGSSLPATISGSIALVALVLIVKLFQNDAARRSAEAVRQQRLAVTEKEGTQAAILRLMNELGGLADGDLTSRATVTEDVTGAIADSVNYAIDELAVLVRRINEAAEQVALATGSAHQISSELLAANDIQTQEVQHATTVVGNMARSMTEVSASAQQSADVARTSLNVARKGAGAVAETIEGMNEIQTKIQDTAKRITRLGESSQQIGEIVELISDITEQTHVLALNASIQATSAGEAGRGFSVVAENVQRLAERSAEATKQIAALVKTIQTDTHDAVAAMESTTRNVADGAKRSDAAGQSLAEISQVSTRLAELIERIALATQRQADTALEVAGTMEKIRQITDQTNSGTEQTAVSIDELATLAVELKGSVAGFRV